MLQDAVFLSREGPAAVLTLNRPDKRNALTEAMWRAIPPLLAEAAADPSARMLMVRGEGGAFAAGADIAEFSEVYATRERAEGYSAAVAAALDGLAGFGKPTLAVIEGACVGGGCGLALACDLRFAAQGAKFGITPGKLGLVYTLNDTRRLVDAVGVSAAKDILFTGRLIEGVEALRLRLIDRLVPADHLKAEAREWAETLARASSHSARVTKAIIARIQAGQAEDDADTRRLFADAFQGPHFEEGYRAFMEKRKPDFPPE